MNGDYIDGLVGGVFLGTALGLLLAYVVLPGVVDVWYAAIRILRQRRARHWHGR